MVNPVTQAILTRIKDRHLIQFVSDWDELESLVVQVFRRKMVTDSEEETYFRLRKRLSNAYPNWEVALQPYWQQSRIKGQKEVSDPFLRLLTPNRAADFVGDWEAMKNLPAAREALNNYLLSRIGSAGSQLA